MDYWSCGKRGRARRGSRCATAPSFLPICSTKRNSNCLAILKELPIIQSEQQRLRPQKAIHTSHGYYKRPNWAGSKQPRSRKTDSVLHGHNAVCVLFVAMTKRYSGIRTLQLRLSESMRRLISPILVDVEKWIKANPIAAEVDIATEEGLYIREIEKFVVRHGYYMSFLEARAFDQEFFMGFFKLYKAGYDAQENPRLIAGLMLEALMRVEGPYGA